MKFKYVLFDFDGTIAESSEGIINSITYALSKFNVNLENKETLYRFIGPPLYDSFQTFCGFSPEKALEATRYFKEYYDAYGMYECRLYEGIPELLRRLNESEKIVILATSKPEDVVIKMLEYHHIADCFHFVAGSIQDMLRRTKSEVIKYAVESQKIDVSLAVMAGDRRFDVEGAKEFGIASVGVTYGYGSEAELINAGANFIAHSVNEMTDILFGV